MKTPAMNRNGYTKSAVNNMLGFKNPNVHFLLVHGTADDNGKKKLKPFPIQPTPSNHFVFKSISKIPLI